MKKYFAKYLPVEGEIKDDDHFEEEDITGKKYILKNLGPLSLLPHDHLKRRQKVKLFLCSKDIEVGDIVKEQLLNGELEDFTIHTLNDIDLDKQFKVIGEITSDAIWVKEGDEFIAEGVECEVFPIHTHNFDEEGPNSTIIYTDKEGNIVETPIFLIKCPTCKRFH